MVCFAKKMHIYDQIGVQEALFKKFLQSNVIATRFPSKFAWLFHLQTFF